MRAKSLPNCEWRGGEAGKRLTLEILDAVGVKHAGAFRKRGFPAALERQEHAPAANGCLLSIRQTYDSRDANPIYR
ncbi:hypothetical protein PF005_g16412 [Phytophthora fragariae]|uniref:Uncharacterized protein n=1 Tax=Phytophthora fragariae TaxID=53985 RepID=A0A6A3T8Y9_9STRA|nr:hypothetical protein PF003_g23619 [Phytophthora fragariae]KAE8926354.1 hypothetical protein PF009_g23454 [Phytophthora fragariae]KAE8987841.1 hypothetical protein PF011_g19419 [Phytophthora fragariae]KAE9097483.1 hypothetical protein PF010_g15939 [Phytophthora fragariae]KAE9098526.1 hypothetical protein PF007_g16231 [Phytophthora fragariae]